NMSKDEYSKGDPYNVDYNNYFHSERLKNTLKILKKITSNSKILDVGCGKGHFTKEFALKNNKVLGVDYSQTAINYANKNFSNKKVKFEKKDASELIKLKEKYDVIV